MPGQTRAPLKHDPADILVWDVKNWSRAIDLWRALSSINLAGARVLEIGSDHGGLSLWLASEGAAVVCSDINGPKPEARVDHAAAGYVGSVTYEAIDALAIPYSGEFDIVVMRSVLGIIGDPCTREAQARAIGQIHRSLRPGGEFFFAENLPASPIHRFLRRRYVDWAGIWRYPSREEMLEFLEPFRSVEYETFGFAGTFGRTEGQRGFLAAADRLLFDRLVPQAWNYIMAGVAVR